MADAIDTTARSCDGGVVVHMQTPGGFITVRVTYEALVARDGGPKTHNDYTKMFNRHRYTIEGVARRKFDANRIEKDGSVLVTDSDLQG